MQLFREGTFLNNNKFTSPLNDKMIPLFRLTQLVKESKAELYSVKTITSNNQALIICKSLLQCIIFWYFYLFIIISDNSIYLVWNLENSFMPLSNPFSQINYETRI